MPFLLLLIALFIFTLARDEQDVAFFILMMIVAAVLARYNRRFRDSLREFF
jgi:positive regulator of sigma E activity